MVWRGPTWLVDSLKMSRPRPRGDTDIIHYFVFEGGTYPLLFDSACESYSYVIASVFVFRPLGFCFVVVKVICRQRAYPGVSRSICFVPCVGACGCRICVCSSSTQEAVSDGGQKESENSYHHIPTPQHHRRHHHHHPQRSSTIPSPK